MNKRIILLIINVLFGWTNDITAQDNVGIGTTTPHNNAVLDIESNDKGLLIPRLTNTQRTSLGTVIGAIEVGLLVFDSDETIFYFWDGTQWNPIPRFDPDEDPANEIQVPSFSNDTLYLNAGSNEQFVVFPGDEDNQQLGPIELDGTILTIGLEEGGTLIVDLQSLVNDMDSVATNELQSLQYDPASNQLIITNDPTSTPINLGGLTGTDDQVIDVTLVGTNLQIELEGNAPISIDLAAVASGGLQNLSSTPVDATGNIDIGISGGTGTSININDGDFDATNEIQLLGFDPGTSEVTLSNGGGSFTIPAAGAQTISFDSATGTVVLSDGGGSFMIPASGAQTISLDTGTGTVTLSDGGGSFVIPSAGAQTISLDPATSTVTLSDGGGSFVIPASGAQTISLDPATNTVTLSDGGGSFVIPNTGGNSNDVTALDYNATTGLITTTLADGTMVTSTTPIVSTTSNGVAGLDYDPVSGFITVTFADGSTTTTTNPILAGATPNNVTGVEFDSVTGLMTITLADGTMTTTTNPIVAGSGGNPVTGVEFDAATGFITVTLADGTTATSTVAITSTVDADGDPNNEIQDLNFDPATNILTISGSTSSVTIPTGGTDADSDPTNEIQELMFDATTSELTITGGTMPVVIPTGGTDADSDPTNEIQELDFDPATSILTISGGTNTVTIPTGGTDADADPTNEIQELMFDPATNELTITGGTTPVIIPTGGTDADADPENEIQNLSSTTATPTGDLDINIDGTGATGTTININDADADPLNEIQELMFDPATSELTITGGTTPVTIPTGGTDADADPTNEIQELMFDATTNELTITGGTTPVIIPTGGTDADADPENEIQNLDAVDDGAGNVTIEIDGTGSTDATFSVYDPDSDPLNEIQELMFDPATSELTITGGTTPVTIPTGGTDADADPTNEIQELMFDATTNELTITGGTTPVIIPTGGTDADADPENEIQNLDAVDDGAGNVTIEIDGTGSTDATFSVYDPDSDPMNEIQELMFDPATSELTITGGATPVTIPTGGTDADADPTNEIQELDFDPATSTLTISGGTNSVIIPTGGTDADADPENEIQNLSSTTATPTGDIDIDIDGTGAMGTTININDADADPANEIQDLDFDPATSELTISGSTSSVIIPTGGTDADADPTNETQELDFDPATSTLTISGGTNSVIIPTGGTDADADPENEIQNLDAVDDGAGNVTIEIDGPGSTDATFGVNDADSDPANEIQELDFDPISNELTISGGTNVITIPTGGTDADADPENEIQNLDAVDDGAGNITIEIDGNGSIDATFSVNDADSDPANEIQELDFDPISNELTISGGTNVITIPTGGTDADADPENEIQNLDASDDGAGNVTIEIDGPGSTDATFSVNDADSDPTNEIQELDFDPISNELTISGGTNVITIPTGGTDADADPENEIQNLDASDDGAGNVTIEIDGPGSTDATFSVNDADSDPTNEIQELDFDPISNELTISGGTNVITIPTGGTDADADPENEIQNLDASDDGAGNVTIEIDGPGSTDATFSVNDADSDPANEIQDLDFNPATNELTISGSTSSVTIPTGGDDADADPENELQNLSLTGTNLTLTNPNGDDVIPLDEIIVDGIELNETTGLIELDFLVGPSISTTVPITLDVAYNASIDEDGTADIIADSGPVNVIGSMVIGNATPINIEGTNTLIIGNGNDISSTLSCLTVGNNNTISSTSENSLISGNSHVINSIENGFIGGSSINFSGQNTISVGSGLTVNGNSSAVFGEFMTLTGNNNFVAGSNGTLDGNGSFLLSSNNSSVTGNSSFAVGASVNITGDNSYAFGNTVNVGNDGCFVFKSFDFPVMSPPDPPAYLPGVGITSSGDNGQAIFDAPGGFYIYYDQSGTNLSLVPGFASWMGVSDKNKKHNFHRLNPANILDKYRKLDNHVTWSYKGYDVRNYGPMAQDFYKAFGRDGFGTIGTDTTISTHNIASVNFIAVHELEKRTRLQKEQLEAQAATITALKEEVEALQATKEQNAKLEERLKRIEAMLELEK